MKYKNYTFMADVLINSKTKQQQQQQQPPMAGCNHELIPDIGNHIYSSVRDGGDHFWSWIVVS